MLPKKQPSVSVGGVKSNDPLGFTVFEGLVKTNKQTKKNTITFSKPPSYAVVSWFTSVVTTQWLSLA